MPQASMQITAQELEYGSTVKALDNQLCDGTGKWRLVMRSSIAVRAMAMVRTPDGFVTSLDGVVTAASGNNLVFFGNPASNLTQQTFLRIINHSPTLGSVVINGLDDSGRLSPGAVFMTFQPWEAKQITAQDLESGNPDKGLGGGLGDGDGKWWFVFDAAEDLNLVVSSLVRSSDGFLTNLTIAEVPDISGDIRIDFAHAASDPQRQAFVRLINTSEATGEVTLSAIDDTGTPAPGGDVSFELGPWQSRQMTMNDLELGNPQRGLVGQFGQGNGHWRLTASSVLALRMMSLVRTSDGFLTNLGSPVPHLDGVSDIWMFNPASNTRQQSLLRLINSANQEASVTISGVDDEGNPGTAVHISLPANSAIFLSSQDLENGNVDKGLTGALGNGVGKWRLHVAAEPSVRVMNLLESGAGFMSNLSRAGH